MQPVHRNRILLDGLGRQLGVESSEDWYNITAKQILKSGGASLLQKYGYSPSKLVKSVYYEYTWLDNKFQTKPMGYWENTANQRNFLDRVGYQLGFKTFKDWYQITVDHLLSS